VVRLGEQPRSAAVAGEQQRPGGTAAAQGGQLALQGAAQVLVGRLRVPDVELDGLADLDLIAHRDGPRVGVGADHAADQEVALAGLGPVLVNAQGRTLYAFVPDKARKVTCVSSCAEVWPPVFMASGQMPVASGLVKQSLVGSDPDPAGGRVVTYAGWPLYTFVSDTAPGSVTGQALNINGGLWYVLSPSGRIVSRKP